MTTTMETENSTMFESIADAQERSEKEARQRDQERAERIATALEEKRTANPFCDLAPEEGSARVGELQQNVAELSARRSELSEEIADLQSQSEEARLKLIRGTDSKAAATVEKLSSKLQVLIDTRSDVEALLDSAEIDLGLLQQLERERELLLTLVQLASDGARAFHEEQAEKRAFDEMARLQGEKVLEAETLTNEIRDAFRATFGELQPGFLSGQQRPDEETEAAGREWLEKIRAHGVDVDFVLQHYHHQSFSNSLIQNPAKLKGSELRFPDALDIVLNALQNQPTYPLGVGPAPMPVTGNPLLVGLRSQ